MDLQDRVERLERQNRRMGVTGIVAILVLAATFLPLYMSEPGLKQRMRSVESRVYSLGNPVAEYRTIRAKEFVVVDTNGAERAKLTRDYDGLPGLFLYDEDGSERASLRVTENILDKGNGTVLNLQDHSGIRRVSLGVNEFPSLDSFLQMFDEKTKRVALEVQRVRGGNEAALEFYDDDGEHRISLEIRRTLGLGSVEPWLTFSDENKNSRATLWVGERTGPYLSLDHANGQIEWQAP